MDIKSALKMAITRLDAHSETPALDAQVLLAEHLERTRGWVLAHLEDEVEAAVIHSLEGALQRLEQGEPLPYVLGKWEFFRLEFILTPEVLIPRPETELLVEHALAWLRSHPGKKHILDAGTGSGCIAIALAVNVPDLEVIATDISDGALNVAQQNAEKMMVREQIKFIHADLFPEEIPATPFSLIAANLPYIPRECLKSLLAYGREPTLALDGGEDGLLHIRRLLEGTPGRLAAGGMVLLEIEASEGAAVARVASEIFPDARIELHPDLAGHDRLIKIQPSSA